MERLMQYVWNHRLWPSTDFLTVDGRKIQIIDPGRLNTDSGPDFFNAKVRIGGELWIGNIEIHVRASDWMRHGHHTDPAYDNVVLHVVDTDDAVIKRRTDGTVIPQTVMQCSGSLNSHYQSLVTSSASSLPCSGIISTLDPVFRSGWIDALAFERLNEKADRIETYRTRFTGDWEQAAFITIARALGVGLNGDIFERLAENMPLRIIGRHNDSLLMTEAMVFGMSGLLESAPPTEYADRLKREFNFLKAKFGLEIPQGMIWKMARMRPAAFPHRRLALLSRLLHFSTRFMSRIINIALEENPLERYTSLFALQPEGFWATHYTFSDQAPSTNEKATAPGVGSVTIQTLLINAVVPLLYAYGTAHADHTLTDRAIAMLEQMRPERNSIVRLFTDAGIECGCASHSQGLIQLRRAYCEQRKCLYCRFGHRMLSERVRRQPAVI